MSSRAVTDVISRPLGDVCARRPSATAASQSSRRRGSGCGGCAGVSGDSDMSDAEDVMAASENAKTDGEIDFDEEVGSIFELCIVLAKEKTYNQRDVTGLCSDYMLRLPERCVAQYASPAFPRS